MKKLTFTVAFLLPLAVQAELTFCNGVWTNQSCSEEPKSKIDEKEFKAKSKDEVAGNKKKSLIHEMTMKRIEARRKYGVLFSSEDTEAVCEEANTSLKECRKAVNTYYKLLQENVRNQLDAENQEKDKEEEKTEPVQNQTTVNIVTNPVAPVLTGRDIPKNVEISESGASIAITGNKDGVNVSGELKTKRKRRVIKGFDGGAIQTTPLNFNKKAPAPKATPNQPTTPAKSQPNVEAPKQSSASIISNQANRTAPGASTSRVVEAGGLSTEASKAISKAGSSRIESPEAGISQAGISRK